MESFITKVYGSSSAPALRFDNTNGNFDIEAKSDLTVSVDGQYPSHRRFAPRQRYSHLGLTNATLGAVIGNFDGVNEQVLTVDGLLNVDAMGKILKDRGGLPSAQIAGHVSNMATWNWADSQVPLLVNMLRFAMLRNLWDTSPGVKLGKWGDYFDGHVRIERDQFWPDGYPEARDEPVRWPGGNDVNSYGGWNHLNAYMPPIEANVVDCRGLNAQETLFVLTMIGRWQRQSRFALDFDTPRLSTVTYYRGNAPVVAAREGWFDEDTDLVIPDLPSAAQAWRAYRKYVAQNRLYVQSAAAMTLVSQLGIQLLPDTAEGQAWLTIPKELTMPSFSACRARYPFLLEGKGALISHRALTEWHYVGDRLERLNLLAAVSAEAYQTGLSCRSLRRRMLVKVPDLEATEDVIRRPEMQFAACMAEATRTPVGLNYLSHSYVEWAATLEPEMRVDLALAEDDGSAGYDRVDGGLRVTFLPPPGMPILILPLDPLPQWTPYALCGTVKFDEQAKSDTSAAVTAWKAWEWAWLARLCGYDITLRRPDTLGPSRFFASNESGWTHPLALHPDARQEPLRINGLNEREHSWINLVPIHLRFNNATYTYKLKIEDRFVHPGGNRPKFRVEYVQRDLAFYPERMRLIGRDAMAELRGYFIREEQGFRLAEDVVADVIPEEPLGPSVAEHVRESLGV